MSADSTRPRRSRKAASDRPEKPYPDYPLCPHANGRWQKKIKGKIYYFGKWGRVVDGKMERLPEDGWQDALSEYKESLEAILRTGQKPSPEEERELTVADLCNRFWAAKKKQLEAGEITPRTFAEYKLTTDRLVETFGRNQLVSDLASSDFESLRAGMAEQWGPYRLGNEVQKVRTVFKYGYESGLLKSPMRFGPQFKKPSARVIRKHRAEQPKKMLEPNELRKLIEAAPAQLKAMVLLGLNCGLGNNDCALLTFDRIDLDGGWLDFPRPKTGIERRCPLWPETVTALREAIAERPEPKTEEGRERVFITSRGRPWITQTTAGEVASDQGAETAEPSMDQEEISGEATKTTYFATASPVTTATSKLMKEAGVKKRGIGFYTLRHIFRTVADGSGDQVAVNSIMGHVDDSMASVYREQIEDSRLLTVTNHVRAWLWPRPPKQRRSKKAAEAKQRQEEHRAADTATEDRPMLRVVG